MAVLRRGPKVKSERGQPKSGGVLPRSTFRFPLCFSLFLTGLLWAGAWSVPRGALADDALNDYRLSITFYKKKRWNDAAASFRKFIKQHPTHVRIPTARLYLGLTLVNQENYKQARDVLRDFVTRYPNSRNLPGAMYRVADCSYSLNDLKAAETEFKAFLKKYPRNELAEWALPYLADTQLRLKKPAEAVTTYQNALKKFPKGRLVDDAKFGLARAYEALGKRAEALSRYRKLAADRNGEFAAQSQMNLAAILFDSGQYAESAAAYNDLVRRFPRSRLVPIARLNAGYAEYQRGEYVKAVAQFKLAAAEKSQTVTAEYWVGLSYKSLKDYPRAVGILKTAFTADPTGPLAHSILFQWADCELLAGRNRSAEHLFLDLVRRWSKDPSADDSLHLAAEAALRDNRLDDADKLAARFDKEYPDSPLRGQHRLLRGRLLAARGGRKNLTAAIERFREVLAESKSNADKTLARFYLARTYSTLEDHRQVLAVSEPLAKRFLRTGASTEYVDVLLLRAASFLDLGKPAQAATSASTYLKFLPAGPRADRALALRAIAAARQNRMETAQADLATLRIKYPRSAQRMDAVQQIAEFTYSAKQWDISAKLFETLSRIGPTPRLRAMGLSGRAWSQYKAKQYRPAAKGFGQLLKAYPADTEFTLEAAYMQGIALRDAKRPEEAVAAFRSAFTKSAPPKAPPRGAEKTGAAGYAYRAGLEAARTLAVLKKISEADTAYERLLKAFPHAADLDERLREWALMQLDAGHFDRSDELFRRLIRETPNSSLVSRARLRLAESDFVAGRLDKAKLVFRRLEADSQTDGESRERAVYQLIRIGIEQETWKQVQTDAANLLKRFPRSPNRLEVRFASAEAQLHLGDFKAARHTLEELKSDPAAADAVWFPRIWVLLAEIALQQKKYADVKQAVEEMRKKYPKSPLLYQADEVLGRSYKNQAQFEQARAAFRKVVTAAAGRGTETAAKSQFLLAETWLLQKKYRTAQQEYFKVYLFYKKHPRWQAPALYQAAVCDAALEEWKNAVKDYEELIREFPKSEYAKKAGPRLRLARMKAGS